IRIAEQVVECFRRGREVGQQADAFAARLDASRTASPAAMNRARMWSWDELVKAAPAVTRTGLEFLYWTSLDGFQTEKWTPLETNTPFYPQRGTGQFEQAVSGGYWRARNDPDAPFAAELLISPTTSAPIAVLTMPSRRNAEMKLDPERRAIDHIDSTALRPV